MTSVSERTDRRPASPSGAAQPWWRLELLLLAVIVGGLAMLLPLRDPDLPMHLATGEWIVRHRAVPLVEPFAWTRAGEPFYAYSWLPETIFYLVHAQFGPVGLRVLQGLLMVGVGAAAVTLGRAAGWRPGTMILLPALSVLVAAVMTPSLRPQIVLLIGIPLVWAEIYRLRAGGRLLPSAVRLVVISAVVANSHLFFALVLAPVALLLADRPVPVGRIVVAGGSLVAGWIFTPYLLHWPELLRANLASNPLLAYPSPIAELQPGFRSIIDFEIAGLPALLLLLLPWFPAFGRRAPRERLLAAAYWSIGLVAFATAVRLQLFWWLLVLPFAGWVVDDRAAGEATARPRAWVRLPAYAALLGMLLYAIGQSRRAWPHEGSTGSRRLPTVTATNVEPLASWLSANIREDARGRLFTVFDFGSYLTWRLPRISPSIDGRTLFPDSVANAVTLAPADGEVPTLGPWRSADLAIVPLNRRVAGVLDTASDWTRVATVPGTPRPHGAATGLWVRRSWWARVGRTPLPATPVELAPLGAAGATRAALPRSERHRPAGGTRNEGALAP